MLARLAACTIERPAKPPQNAALGGVTVETTTGNSVRLAGETGPCRINDGSRLQHKVRLSIAFCLLLHVDVASQFESGAGGQGH